MASEIVEDGSGDDGEEAVANVTIVVTDQDDQVRGPTGLFGLSSGGSIMKNVTLLWYSKRHVPLHVFKS